MNIGGLLNAAKALVRFPALYDDCLGQIRSSITGGMAMELTHVMLEY